MEDTLKFTKKNFFNILFLIILIVTIPFGINLVRQQQIIRSRAVIAAIEIVKDDCIEKRDSKKVLICPDIPLKIVSPIGGLKPKDADEEEDNQSDYDQQKNNDNQDNSEQSPTPQTSSQSDNFINKTSVTLLKFKNSKTTSLTKQDLEGIMFSNPDSVNSYYKANSFGKVTVSGDVIDWISLPIEISESSKCEADSWINQANEISKINQANYKSFVYIWPENIKDCGVAFVSGNKLAINGEEWVRKEYVILHEFGHLVSPRVNDSTVVGVNHASFYRCTNGSITEPCKKEEYGDRYTRMGALNLFNFHGVHKLALGWLPNSVVKEVNQSGQYKLNKLGTPENGIKLLKIKKSDSGDNSYYYLEYRKDIRFDPIRTEIYPISLNKITNGVTIRLWNDDPASQTLLIDTTPSTPTPEDNHSGENPDEALSDGVSFSDEKNDIKITQVLHDDNSATIEVTLPVQLAQVMGESTQFQTQSTPTPSPAPFKTPKPTKKPIIYTKSFKVTESERDLLKAEEFEYTEEPEFFSYTLKNKEPGLKQIWVEFKNSSGVKHKAHVSIQLVEEDPDIKQISCKLDLTAQNVVFDIRGERFGDVENAGLESDQGVFKVLSWSDSQVSAVLEDLNLKSSNENEFKVKLKRSDGQETESVSCELGVSELSLGTQVFCREKGSLEEDNVSLILLNKSGNKIAEQVKINKDGIIKGMKTKLQTQENYTVSIKTPTSLRRNALFTAGEGTQVVRGEGGEDLTLPIGDIAPTGGDGVINSQDKSELNKQWDKPTQNLSGDFNRDGIVNTFDWACMSHSFGQVDDPLIPKTLQQED
ncbi:hypothetical protein HYS97_00040 [Candidatus Daviesbacteria bacterium]|nr:hypothetical protein [Candidatus Daviesbacteria bacterium]